MPSATTGRFGRGGVLRVTGGRLRGRRLRAPRGAGVRPSADRVREALFARLGELERARVLDLFAGSGALGIEALSRGAREAAFVERSTRVLAVLRANLEALELTPLARVLAGEASAVVRRLARAGAAFDVVLLDPPYASPDAVRALRALVDSGILAPGARVVLETSRRSELPEVPGLVRIDERRYGDTLVLRFAPAGERAQDGEIEGSEEP